jgi:pimeloyl-ACP methyl ester carboxylesterase
MRRVLPAPARHRSRSTASLVVVAVALLGCDADDPETDPAPEDAGVTDPAEPDDEVASDAPAADGDVSVDGAFVADADCFGIESTGLEDDEVACGMVTVPLDHADPDGDTIELAVATLEGDGRYDEPVLILGGGPGQATVEATLTEPVLRQLYAADGRDIVLLDQRGVGASIPELRCSAFDDQALDHAPDEADVLAAITTCRDELTGEGIDLDAFNHVNNALDVDAVRRALGHEQVVLRGTSYGTHLGLHAASLNPDGVLALVLSSPADPSDNYIQTSAAGFQAAFDRVTEACNLDERCAEQVGDLGEAIDAVVDRLDADPEEVTAEPPAGGEEVTRTFTPEIFTSAVFLTFYLPDGGFGLPSLVGSANDGDLEPIAGLYAAIEQEFAAIPQGMNFSMVCSGEGALFDAEQARADLTSPTLEAFWFEQAGIARERSSEVCDAWDVQPAFDPSEFEFATEVPTLLFTGELDHVTPPSLGAQVAEALPRSHLVEVPSLAHSPLEGLDALLDGCGRQIVVAFLDDPDNPPDTTCMGQLPSLEAIGRFLP